MNKENNRLARQKLTEAIAIDPSISGAYALISGTHINGSIRDSQRE
jgi:hypothetical protein